MRRGLTLLALLALCLCAGMTAAAAGEMVPRAKRDVTAPGMTPGPAADGPLERETVPPPPPEPPRWHRFLLPETSDAATFRAKGRTIEISGVAPPRAGESCRSAGGDTWPCGRTALHALRMFLRGRAVECLYPPADADLIIAPCRVGPTDLGLWLLSEGWAKPDGNATDAYRAAAHDAACAGKGLWRGARPADCRPGD